MALHNPRKTNGNIFILQRYRKQFLWAFRQKEANYLARMKIPLTLGFSATRSEDNLTTSNRVFRENVGNNLTLKNSIIFQGSSTYFQTCKALHHRPSCPSLKNTHKRAVKMKNSVMRKLWFTRTYETNLTHFGPKYSYLVDLHVVWSVLGTEGELVLQNFPELFLLRHLSCPRKCISCLTCFTPCFRRNVMFDDCLKLIWFPTSANVGLAAYLVEIQCREELNTPLFSEQSHVAYWSFSCPDLAVLLIGQD